MSAFAVCINSASICSQSSMLYPDAGSILFHKAGACCNVSIINYFLDGLFNVIVVSECWLPPRIPVPPSTLL